MITASILTTTLIYLIGLRAADKRQNKVVKEIQQYREITVCSLFDL